MNVSKPVQTLLVDDATLDLVVFRRMLSKSPDIEVVGVAQNGKEALARIAECDPDVVCTDLNMPVMDGLALTREIMASEKPLPILVLSAYVGDRSSSTVFDLLEAGAVDVMPKPAGGLADERAGQELINRIKLLSGVTVLRRRRTTVPAARQPISSSTSECVAIGASTGGPPALLSLLKPLPADFPIPIVIVQHISPGFSAGLVSWLDGQCALTVRQMVSGARAKAGVVYFPVEDHHLIMRPGGVLLATQTDPFNGHRPSVNDLFHSVARVCGKRTLAILLTGMGEDGAEGLLAVREAGGETMAQDEASSVVFGMAKRAFELTAVERVVPLTKILERLQAVDAPHA